MTRFEWARWLSLCLAVLGDGMHMFCQRLRTPAVLLGASASTIRHARLNTVYLDRLRGCCAYHRRQAVEVSWIVRIVSRHRRDRLRERMSAGFTLQLGYQVQWFWCLSSAFYWAGTRAHRASFRLKVRSRE